MTLVLATRGEQTERVSRFAALDGEVWIDGHAVTNTEACELIHEWASEAGNLTQRDRIAALYHHDSMELWCALRQARLQAAAKRSRRGWAA